MTVLRNTLQSIVSKHMLHYGSHLDESDRWNSRTVKDDCQTCFALELNEIAFHMSESHNYYDWKAVMEFIASMKRTILVDTLINRLVVHSIQCGSYEHGRPSGFEYIVNRLGWSACDPRVCCNKTCRSIEFFDHVFTGFETLWYSTAFPRATRLKMIEPMFRAGFLTVLSGERLHDYLCASMDMTRLDKSALFCMPPGELKALASIRPEIRNTQENLINLVTEFGLQLLSCVPVKDVSMMILHYAMDPGILTVCHTCIAVPMSDLSVKKRKHALPIRKIRSDHKPTRKIRGNKKHTQNVQSDKRPTPKVQDDKIRKHK